MGEIAIMGTRGDTKIIWDSEKPFEVENAKRTFNDLVQGRGYAAFSVGEKGKKDEKVTRFDPNMEKLILIPPIEGG